MRIVIAGAGEVGMHLTKMLSSENHELVIIDNDLDLSLIHISEPTRPY